MSNIQENIKALHKKIEKACIRNKEQIRDSGTVRLVAVSKKQPAGRVKAALEAGQRLFGENRVQEALARWGPLKPDYPDVTLHMLGPLQTNKVKDAVALFDVIETLDRPKLAGALAEEMKKQSRFLPCFIQVNTGEEPQKSGIFPHDLPDFLKECHDLGINIVGLMCIPPIDEPSALHFAFLKKLADTHQLKELSMGMSHDFEKAIPLGATYIRIGTALFGARE